ncbi:hypothetical protein AB6A40_009436 [Gnathostoma spinigerum]|uniref:Amidase domain-containing protein n=1 Tax=Gnathostoma spinigerum TaxID=75299 RepID=A0ABD6F0N2_9BILA
MDISCASFLVVFLCIYIAFLFYKRKRFETRCHRLESAVKYALDRRQQSIETVKVKLDEVDAGLRQHIASMDFQVLLDSLQNGKVTALQVLRAYQEKALAAQEKTNCITQFILEADDWAKTLDEQFETNKGTGQRPPFFGIPFSIKECIGVSG